MHHEITEERIGRVDAAEAIALHTTAANPRAVLRLNDDRLGVGAPRRAADVEDVDRSGWIAGDRLPRRRRHAEAGLQRHVEDRRASPASLRACVADESDRAELLERITGTEIYSRLSKAAYARSKAEREALEKLELAASEIRVLDEAARAEVEAKLQISLVAEAEAEAARKGATAQIAWYAQRAKLTEEVALAEGELDAAAALAEREIIRHRLVVAQEILADQVAAVAQAEDEVVVPVVRVVAHQVPDDRPEPDVRKGFRNGV